MQRRVFIGCLGPCDNSAPDRNVSRFLQEGGSLSLLKPTGAVSLLSGRTDGRVRGVERVDFEVQSGMSVAVG